MQKVKGHPGWWKYELNDHHSRYQYYPPSRFGESKVFISREEITRLMDYGMKYSILLSGGVKTTLPNGKKSAYAKRMGGAKTLKEAIKKAEKIMKELGESGMR